ncbi:restriction endonuclease subunit S [Halobacillus kuroshimensis]|uniref:Restriction endonuclease subunit S n=1 Tax=Halobacillus kuroshimensis TaxID=302481 RepID=A0ABS3DTR2_9BACI|nr:restriction endonuclease subunit S [Halobacillus kuroshimensis]MBN8234722.1 restriction endonuclease subunit S [Halobacillus kuroshimensis]
MVIRMIKIGDLFHVKYGLNMELNKLKIKEEHGENTVNFVSRTSKNNGVSAIVEKVEGIEPLEAGLITVSGGGSVLETFVQPSPFYSGRDLYYLDPKKEMSIKEKIFYCMCIRANKYRYSYGRQANRTLRDIHVPNEIPEWVFSVNQPSYFTYKGNVLDKDISLNPHNWQEFDYTELFEVKKGKRVKITEIKDDNGKYNFVSAIDHNNGVSCKTNLEPLFPGNVISVNYDGNGVAEAYYQKEPFWALDSVNVLVPKFKLNQYIAMFLITLIRKEKYRFNYGRKWHKERMENSTIKLPVDKNGVPDWCFIEDYIKTLPYSNSL